MAKNKMIKKNCPFCGIQVAVACKTCPGCKHSFYTSKRNNSESAVASSGSESVSSGSRRRTERVKREKPNYYDASEYETKTKKKRLERGQNQGRDNRGRPPNSQNLKKKKKKAKTTKESEDDVTTMLSPEKTLQCSIILAELNRKFKSTTWRM